jgi:hypothetical protein
LGGESAAKWRGRRSLARRHVVIIAGMSNDTSAVRARVIDEMEMTSLSPEAVEARRRRQVAADRVVFRVAGLYGLCPEGLAIPLAAAGTIDSGPVAVTIDPDAEQSCNIGMIDFPENKLKVRYGVQAVFPALYKLVTSGDHDRSLLNPVRIVATDDCTLTPNLMGWRALGCLDFLPGSVWSGAGGG